MCELVVSLILVDCSVYIVCLYYICIECLTYSLMACACMWMIACSTRVSVQHVYHNCIMRRVLFVHLMIDICIYDVDVCNITNLYIYMHVGIVVIMCLLLLLTCLHGMLLS